MPTAERGCASLGYVGQCRAHRPAHAVTPRRRSQAPGRAERALQHRARGVQRRPRRRRARGVPGAAARARRTSLTARTSAATVLMATGRAPRGRDAAACGAGRAGVGAPTSWPGSAPRFSAEPATLPAPPRALERARAAGYDNPELLNDLGVVYARLGRAPKRGRMFERAAAPTIRPRPRPGTTWACAGAVRAAARRRGGRVPPGGDRRSVHARRVAGARRGARSDAIAPAAIDAWRHAERLLPRDYDLLFNLGMVLAESERPAEALPYLTRFLREAPPARYARDLARVEAAIAKAAAVTRRLAARCRWRAGDPGRGGRIRVRFRRAPRTGAAVPPACCAVRTSCSSPSTRCAPTASAPTAARAGLTPTLDRLAARRACASTYRLRARAADAAVARRRS